MNGATSSEQPAVKPSPTRRRFPWNRTVHRIAAVSAVLLMLWLSGTGTTIQVLDLHAALTHIAPSDPTALSIAEGMYGPGNFAVMQVRDFDAPSFPAGFDFQKAVATVLQAARSRQTTGADTPAGTDGASFERIAWLDLRMIGGTPLGQVMAGKHIEAFNARTGESTVAVPPEPIPQGGRLPPSLRQKVKTLHRFWNRGDTPGVYFEFFAGLVLWLLIITGLIVYFELLKARARLKRRQLFWLTGGVWRGLHRSTSMVAAAFLVCMAFSGTWIGFESSFNALGRTTGQRPPSSSPSVLSDAEIGSMTAVTLQAMRQLHPSEPLKALRLRTYGYMKQGVVIAGRGATEQYVFDAETGKPASLSEPSYPPSGFPFGVQMHENIKHFHSGEMFGVTGQCMNLFAGLSLLFLSISGLKMYADMWLARRKSGRNALLWR